ncbi:hypothetical protein NL676_015071 [Syzygium grande]|nr:hypothetical protein NL676_015071 [Syzygium grande]
MSACAAAGQKKLCFLVGKQRGHRVHGGGKRRNWPWTTIERETDDNKSDKKTGKEIKGAVDDPPPSPPKARNPRETDKTGDEATRAKGLPHQQVPQPGDFSSEVSRDYDVSLCDVFCSLLK